MKKLIPIILMFISINISAQHPKVFITESQIIEQNITELTVTLDSAAKGYTLPFDTIKQISFDQSGKKIKEIGYTSDVVYIQNKVEYYYFKDSTEILRIDSSFNGPDFLIDVDTAIVIQLMKEDKLHKVKYYPWSKNNKLDRTKIYEYNSEGKISKKTTINEPLKSKMPGLTVTSQRKSVLEYFYDDDGQLIETINSSERTNNEKEQQSTKYHYEDKKQTILTERQDFTGNKWYSKEENYFDEEGNKIKTIQFSRKGEIWYTTYYEYYENGLLQSEEAYNGDEFAYRFVTTYK